jgi:hypothetical protein
MKKGHKGSNIDYINHNYLIRILHLHDFMLSVGPISFEIYKLYPCFYLSVVHVLKFGKKKI